MPGRLMPMKLATSTAKNRMLQGRGIGRGGGGGAPQSAHTPAPTDPMTVAVGTNRAWGWNCGERGRWEAGIRSRT